MNEWRNIKSAPKDGSRFIGLYSRDEVYTTWWQAFNVYEKKEDGSHFVSGKTYDWTHDKGDSHGYGKPKGWMPLPARKDAEL